LQLVGLLIFSSKNNQLHIKCRSFRERFALSAPKAHCQTSRDSETRQALAFQALACHFFATAPEESHHLRKKNAKTHELEVYVALQYKIVIS
jgi:hypothetical protein